MAELRVFEPARYSLAELEFLKAHITEPSIVALGERLPPGVNPAAIREVLDTLYALEQLREHRGQPWRGHDAVLKSIDAFLESYKADEDIHRHGGPRYPSMYFWDKKGRAHDYGPGADTTIVQSKINRDGTRTYFAVDLLGDAMPLDFTPAWAPVQEDLPNDLTEDQTKGFVQCPICGFAANYQPESASARNLARARVGKHMKAISGPTADQHRELYIHIFGA